VVNFHSLCVEALSFPLPTRRSILTAVAHLGRVGEEDSRPYAFYHIHCQIVESEPVLKESLFYLDIENMSIL